MAVSLSKRWQPTVGLKNCRTGRGACALYEIDSFVPPPFGVAEGFWRPFVALIDRFRAYGVLRPPSTKTLVSP